jgi:hypothetical protein
VRPYVPWFCTGDSLAARSVHRWITGAALPAARDSCAGARSRYRRPAPDTPAKASVEECRQNSDPVIAAWRADHERQAAAEDCAAARRSSDRTRVGIVLGQRVSKLPTTVDIELSKHLSQMPLNRARAEEQPRGDLRVRQPITGQLGDLPLLRGQIVARLNRTSANDLTRRQKLTPGAFGERQGPVSRLDGTRAHTGARGPVVRDLHARPTTRASPDGRSTTTMLGGSDVRYDHKLTDGRPGRERAPL